MAYVNQLVARILSLSVRLQVPFEGGVAEQFAEQISLLQQLNLQDHNAVSLLAFANNLTAVPLSVEAVLMNGDER